MSGVGSGGEELIKYQSAGSQEVDLHLDLFSQRAKPRTPADGCSWILTGLEFVPPLTSGMNTAG